MVAGGSDILVAAPGLNPVLNIKHKTDRRYAAPLPSTIAKRAQSRRALKH